MLAMATFAAGLPTTEAGVGVTDGDHNPLCRYNKSGPAESYPEEDINNSE